MKRPRSRPLRVLRVDPWVKAIARRAWVRAQRGDVEGSHSDFAYLVIDETIRALKEKQR